MGAVDGGAEAEGWREDPGERQSESNDFFKATCQDCGCLCLSRWCSLCTVSAQYKYMCMPIALSVF